MKLKIGLILSLWLSIVTASFGWNLYLASEQRGHLALETARSFFQQILIARRWNARHAGVYVPVSPETPPNPYLKVERRDIRVSESLLLTKVNPAYMTRQLSDIAAEQNNIQFHITSLKPIRPENRPTDWERHALETFEQGVTEFGQFTGTDANARYNYMAPLITEKPCLECHAEQGYEVGDVRGGISIRLPHVAALPWQSLAATHALIALLGVGSILWLGRMLKRSYDQLRQQAVLDALTSIPNRRYFIEHLVDEFRRGRRCNAPLSLMICDIDNFKTYNDLFGHQAGDRCLMAVAWTLRDSLRRGGDFCARYGGEEFVVVLPNTPLANAVKVAETIRDAVAGLGMQHPGSPFGIVTLSIGVATDDARGPGYEMLIRRADEALYRAKDRGRNRVEMHVADGATMQPCDPPRLADAWLCDVVPPC